MPLTNNERPPGCIRVNGLLLTMILSLIHSAGHAHGSAEGSMNPVKPAIPVISVEAPLVQLGHKIFSDKRLSYDGTISCASCHQPERAFTDGKGRAEGIRGQPGTRNTPSLHNTTYTIAKFWDGRRATLMEQVLDPFINPREHGLADHSELHKRLQGTADYTKLFQLAFGHPPEQSNADEIAKALSAYVSQLRPQSTRVQRFLSKQETVALSATEKHGLELFRGRTHCADCHHLDIQAASLTDGEYHTRGVGLKQVMPRLAKLTKTVATMSIEDRALAISADSDIAALGRFVVTLQPTDIGKFKTPSLYEVAVTAPYMHDGSLATLEAAMDWELYYQGLDSNQPIVLSEAERADLLAFLQALTNYKPARPHEIPKH